MKSFGVRLAAGAVTILFGAYAAALAQKDRQDESDSWTAEAPSIEAPASPIAVDGDDSWLDKPGTELDAGKSTIQYAESTFQPAGSVQLVQHSTPIADDESTGPTFDGAFPATLGVHQDAPGDFSADVANESGTPSADWMMPDSSQSAEASAAAPAMSMTFPSAEVVASEQGGTFAPEPRVQDSSNDSADPGGSEMPAMEFYPAEQFHVDAPQGESAKNDHAYDHVPAVVAGGAAAGIVASGAAAAPANLLRGTPDGVNALREHEGEALADDQELAYETESDGNAILFSDSPTGEALGAEVPNSQALTAESYSGATAGLGTPQPNGMAAGDTFAQPNAYPQGDGYAQPNSFAPSDYPVASERTASLPNAAPPATDTFRNDYQPAAMAQPGSAVAIDPSITLDSPGERRLEGAQTPSIIIQKRAPAEVKVGKPASFVVHVQNVGAVEALNVEVHDRVPAGMRLVDASPSPIQQGNMLMWELGAMPAGDERTITMQLIPEQEGELGSVARVSFEAAASVRTISTRPELKIVQRVPEKGVLIGQQLEIELEVSNPGSGAATGVILQEDVPEGLEHPKGRQLDNALGTLAPGEVRNQVLRLRAVSPGIIQNTIRLAGDDGLEAEHTVTVQVVAPDLQIELSGPSKRFLERQATYQLNVANNGTADATNVEIAVQLARGFTFVSTDYEGQYDPSRHAVFWSLAQLPAGANGSVPLTLLPVEAGEQAIKIEARADLGVLAKSERTMTVEGFAELSFAISNTSGPIEVGAETNYEIVVTNSGSKADSNVRVQLQLPPGLESVSTDGEAGTDGRGLIAFQPKPQLAPGEELKYGLRVRGVSPGTHIVRAIVVSDQSTVPVTKEESTRVYADQ